MIISTKFVAKNSLMLLFIVYWAFHYIDLIENDQIVHLLFVFKISFCKINIFFKNNIEFLQSYQMLIMFVIFAFSVEFDWMFINFIERKFFIVFLILNCIAFVRLFDRRNNFEIVIWTRFRFVIAWFRYWKFILNRNFRQVVFAFSIVLMFLICHYHYKQSRIWNDWRLSLKTFTKSNDWNHVCKFVIVWK